MLKRLLFLLCLATSFSAMSAPSVVFETTQGNFTVELDADKAPVTVKNFLRYVEDGSYAGSIFHRVIPGFMVQGGGFNRQMNRLKSYPPIKNEASNGLKNLTATIAMARTQNPDSATRQFYINLVDNHFLDYGERPPGYAVFGRVTSGFSTIQAIGKQKTKTAGHMQNVPVKPIVITKVTLVKEKNMPEQHKATN
jgi:peptidyl-prolyl cis-trans isomerase A (cyclophilin A)